MAKKSKGFRELLSQQSLQQIERQSFEALEKKLARDGISTKFIPSPKGAKMSDALEELVRPYLDFTEDRESLQGLLSMGAFAWNIAAIPEEDRQELFETAFATMKNQGADLVEQKDLVKTLIERKEKLFPDNCRKIMNFELKYTGRGDYHISVASTIE
jgi:hypothetical protein